MWWRNLKSSKVRVIFSLALFLVVQPLSAQETAAAEQQNQATNLPYEVVVTPTMNISRLRNLLFEIEDDFFAKFNELNTDDKYDVRCYKFKPARSHISRRVCEPNFYISARSENSSEIAFNLGGCATCTKPPPLVMSRSDLRFDTRKDFELLQEKLENFYATDAEFNSIGEALADIKSRIENYSASEED